MKNTPSILLILPVFLLLTCESEKLPTTPVITTTAITSFTSTTAQTGGNVTSDGGAAVTARGVCWSTGQDPTAVNDKTTDGSGTGEFTSNLTGLLPNTTYYVKAYATNSLGTAYGNQVSFTTSQNITLPSVTTTPVTSITSTSAQCGGNVTSDGAASVTARGVCWSTSLDPTTANSKTTDGSGTGSFTSNLTGLSPNTTYYVRAYATNSQGTAYGNQVSFTAGQNISSPTVTTTLVTSITSTSAKSGGNITSDGGASITARGVCWSKSQNPTTSNSKTTDGNGTGDFKSNLTGLSPNTIYYVRAYATNSQGTAYGSQLNFTTSKSITQATVTTTSVTSITSGSAQSGGNVTNDGGATVTAQGVCWSTSQYPTTANSKTNDGSGTGVFISTLTGLSPNTIYYVRAYATNSKGTAYGNQVDFTTTPIIIEPTVTTTDASSIMNTTAILNGTVNANYLSTTVTFEYGTTTSYGLTIYANQSPVSGSSPTGISAAITGLTSGKTYHFRVRAESIGGTSIGTDVAFETTIKDNDGNNYTIVSIGAQVWMVENLKTTHFNDGIEIANVTNQATWDNLTYSSYCWYHNDEAAYKNIYGALYNWYAINTNKLCPLGWHVPTDAEWTTLENFLIQNGYNYDGTTSGNKIAKSLASTTLWTSSTNTGAVGNTDYPNKRNVTGFTGLPGGFRTGSGDSGFGYIGSEGEWWTSTEYSITNAWNRSLFYLNIQVGRYNSCNKKDGHSVRCLRN